MVEKRKDPIAVFKKDEKGRLYVTSKRPDEEEVKVAKPVKPAKEKVVKKKASKKRRSFKDKIEDLLDDGKINESNK